jgi:hypothetical protein
MKDIVLAGVRGKQLRTEAELRLRLRGYKRCVQPTSISGLRLGSRGVGDCTRREHSGHFLSLVVPAPLAALS